MATNISDQPTLSKLGALIFSRRSPLVEAERQPGVLAQLNSWRARRSAEAELSALSDRELADIGLTRQEIPSVVRRGR
jgi:uncharacterized protein YjiS (DUF1127 family)